MGVGWERILAVRWGEPFEWKRQINKVDFLTTRDLGGEPMPNDDLDIQLLWLAYLEDQGLDVDAKELAQYWALYVSPHWAEYEECKDKHALRIGATSLFYSQ